MTSVYTITLAFGPARIISRSLEAYRKTRNHDLHYRHFVVNHHYPIDKERNWSEIQKTCAILGIETLDPGKNLGLHGGFNWAMQRIGVKDGDIVIGYDGDSLPTTPGWDMALVRAIRGHRLGRVVWSSLMNPRSYRDLVERGYDVSEADNYISLLLTRTAVTNSICAWSYKWLREVGFLDEPLQWYGHLESRMWGKLGGKAWAFLPGWVESDELRDMHDRAYVIYKWHYSHLRDTDLDFEAWLIHNGYSLKTGLHPSAAPTAPTQIP